MIKIKNLTTFKFLFFAFSISFLIAILILGSLTIYTINSFYINDKENDLRARAYLVSELLNNHNLNHTPIINDICRSVSESTNTRITIINSNGTVIADSDEDYQQMDFHGIAAPAVR